MTTPTTPPNPPGATLHLGGTAYASPDLAPLLIPITDVSGWPGNPRRHDQDGITASVRDHGLYQGCVAQTGSNRLLVGHGRYEALVALGAERVPVTFMDVDDTRGAAIVARDNRTSDLSTNDDRLLLDLLAPLADDGDLLALAGYDDGDLSDLLRAIANQEFVDSAGDLPAGVPLGDVADPIDLDGDAEKITVTLDPGHRPDLYALLSEQHWVRNITNTHVKQAKP